MRDQMADLGRFLDRDRSEDASKDYEIINALEPAVGPKEAPSVRQPIAELRDGLRADVLQAVN